MWFQALWREALEGQRRHSRGRGISFLLLGASSPPFSTNPGALILQQASLAPQQLASCNELWKPHPNGQLAACQLRPTDNPERGCVWNDSKPGHYMQRHQHPRRWLLVNQLQPVEPPQAPLSPIHSYSPAHGSQPQCGGWDLFQVCSFLEDSPSAPELVAAPRVRYFCTPEFVLPRWVANHLLLVNNSLY